MNTKSYNRFEIYSNTAQNVAVTFRHPTAFNELDSLIFEQCYIVNPWWTRSKQRDTSSNSYAAASKNAKSASVGCPAALCAVRGAQTHRNCV